MDILDVVRESCGADIIYYKGKMDYIKECLPLLEEIAKKLMLEEDLNVSYYGRTFRFSSSSYEDSRKITSRLLEIFQEIEKFEKEFDGAMSAPRWKWIGRVTKGDITITFDVDHATPQEDCSPRQIAHTYNIWVCEKQE